MAADGDGADSAGARVWVSVLVLLPVHSRQGLTAPTATQAITATQGITVDIMVLDTTDMGQGITAHLTPIMADTADMEDITAARMGAPSIGALTGKSK